MKLFLGIAILALGIASSNGFQFLEDGKEYLYDTEAAAGAGTMDHASGTSGFSYKMKTRVQVSGKTLNVQFQDMQFTQFVGLHKPNSWPFDSTSYTDVPQAGTPTFSVRLGDDGLFQELTVPSDADLFYKNLMRGWASNLQINSEQIRAGKSGFKSTEQLVNGKCDVTYTVTDNAVRKSVSHTEDCENRAYRIIDDYRGMGCKNIGFDNGMGYPSSIASTVFLTEKTANGYQVNAIVSTGSFIAQFFEEEGAAQYVYTNSTSKLVDVKDSAGDISVSGETITDLAYEFADKEYKWNVDRDLKAKEPFFSTGAYFDEPAGSLQEALKKGIEFQKTLLESHHNDKEHIEKAHRYGINSVLPIMYAMDYDTLKGVAEDLQGDKSDTGVMKSNLFGELLGSAGTTAAALLIKDMVMENKFDNDRDAARALTAIPFHIRRPNRQLVKEFEALLNFDGDRFVKMAAPLAFGHLVRITCERAGPFMSAEAMECVNTLSAEYVSKFFDKYRTTDSREEKVTALSVLANLRWGGQLKALKPVIYGEIESDPDLRSKALWAIGYEAMFSGVGGDMLLPIFANKNLEHELRIAALEMIFYTRPSSAQMSSILTVLYNEASYEVVNYAYTLLERYAHSIDPCDAKNKETATYFLKYMKQFSNYETDWGFGVSKTYMRQFSKKKYGYSGTTMFYSIGSTESTMPLAVGFGLTNTMMNNYLSYMFSAHIRLEGVSKAVVHKFKKMDPNTWKTADLEKIFSGEMAIRARPDQPIRAGISLMLKGVIVFQRSYDESDFGADGKFGSLLENMQGLGDTYSINHQRAVQLGALLYEQPTPLGVPMAVMSSLTSMGHLTATVKRGNHRGLLYRDIEYDAHAFTQSARLALVHHPLRKASFGIVNDRIYHKHFPRKIVIGVNPIKKELKLSVTRPEYEKLWIVFMHSQTSVMVRGSNLQGEYEGLQKNCPSCKNRVLISRGPDAMHTRSFVDRTNEKTGSYLHGEYFDCEMDISRGNSIQHTLGAFAPYNKNPKSLWTSLSMGVRQIRAFLYLFPKNEQCGAMLRWSQSEDNPVKEIEIAIRGNVEANGERMFFRGRKWFIKALIKAKGEPADRSYRINMAYEFTPGYLQYNFKIQFNRAPVPALDMGPYSVCFNLENEYPDFGTEFLDYDANNDLSVSGKAMVQYGATSSCSDAEGEIRIKFQHSTTQQARDELKHTWYYKQCMELKNTQAWRGRKTVPVAEPCYMTVFDATNARKYTWNVKFVKLTPRVKALVSNVQTALKAGLLPYWDMDPEEGSSNGDIGPFLNIEATLKNHDKNVDIMLESKQGQEEFSDVPLRLNWSKRLRNLKFTSTLKRLFYSKIINPCIATDSTIKTMDNVTYAYEASSCWTLASGHCSDQPTYAVFTKKASATPLAAKVFIGGHEIEFSPNGPGDISVSVNGSPVSVSDQGEHVHTQDSAEMFKIFRWGSTYHVYSFLKVWVMYDGTFVETIPAPSVKGQHCGLCGNYNRNKGDEFTGKDMSLLDGPSAMVENWQWKC
uniref:Melanin-engaging protein n=1 Tax=Tigriopus kingsejongensis TaxID=1133412 RepID=A0A0U2S221_9MAXI|nr:melanin-engaging protein [Tigriopus kingsejongensis]